MRAALKIKFHHNTIISKDDMLHQASVIFHFKLCGNSTATCLTRVELNSGKKIFHKIINSTKKVYSYTSTLRLVVRHSCFNMSITLSPSPWHRIILSMSCTQGFADGSSLKHDNFFFNKNHCKLCITYWKTKGCQTNLSLITYLSSVAASTGHICKRVPKQSSCERERLSLKRVSNSWCLFVSLSMSSSVSCTKTYMR